MVSLGRKEQARASRLRRFGIGWFEQLPHPLRLGVVPSHLVPGLRVIRAEGQWPGR